ncbi:MAG: YARHG domain-containing protein, partial [Treponemataceae bacterium]|nr:YARHG domain-containing protein [Treponemataceae bacterium]
KHSDDRLRKEQWLFFYFDKNKNIFLRDEDASSWELEDVHGSETFFADYGLDFNALDRELNLQQIQNLCPASLRVLRNAIYARHGRSFKSEDLQALFNEYPWYEASPAYSDSLLTATDKHNIALIKQVEENPKKTSLYLEQTMFDSEIPQTGFSSDRSKIYMAKYNLRCHEISMAKTATKGMATYLFLTSDPISDFSMIDKSFHNSEIEFEQRYGQCKPEKSGDSISYFEALFILCGNGNILNPKNNIQNKNCLTGKELLDLQKSIRKMKAEEDRKKK